MQPYVRELREVVGLSLSPCREEKGSKPWCRSPFFMMAGRRSSRRSPRTVFSKPGSSWRVNRSGGSTLEKECVQNRLMSLLLECIMSMKTKDGSPVDKNSFHVTWPLAPPCAHPSTHVNTLLVSAFQPLSLPGSQPAPLGKDCDVVQAMRNIPIIINKK